MRYLILFAIVLINTLVNAEFTAGEYGIMHKKTGKFLAPSPLCKLCQLLLDLPIPEEYNIKCRTRRDVASSKLSLGSRSQMIRWTLTPLSDDKFELKADGEFQLNADGVQLKALKASHKGVFLAVFQPGKAARYLYVKGSRVFLGEKVGSVWELVSLAANESPSYASQNVRFRHTSSSDMSVNFGPTVLDDGIELEDVSFTQEHELLEDVSL